MTFFACVLVALASSAQGTIKNTSYLNFQTSVPTGNYGLEKGASLPSGDNLHRFYSKSPVAEVSRYAGGIQFGANFYLPFLPSFKPGITCDFIDLNAHYYRFKPITDGDNYNSDLLVTYSLNVGLVGTISPFDGFFIDLYGKLVPTFGVDYMKLPAYTSPFEDRSYLAKSTSAKFNDEEQSTVYGLNYAFGATFRYNIIQFGAEFLTGNLVYDYEDWSKQKLSNKMFRFKVGFFFD